MMLGGYKKISSVVGELAMWVSISLSIIDEVRLLRLLRLCR